MKILVGLLCFILIYFLFNAINQPIIDKDPDNINDNLF